MPSFRLGVDYRPRSSGMQMWRRFDRGEIAEDFAHMAHLGFRVVRFVLDWEAFQPAPFETDPEMLRRFDEVLACASAARIRTMPTLFGGHLDGMNLLPGWVLDRQSPAGHVRTVSGGAISPYGAADTYAGERLEAQRWFARRIGIRAHDDDSVYAWDLGNDFTRVRIPESAARAAHWSAALAHDLYDASNRPATGGLHAGDLTRDRVVRPSSVAEPWAFASLHGDASPAAFASFRPGVGDVPFLAALASDLARKPLFVTSFGSSDLGEDETAASTRDVVDRLHRDGAIGALFHRWADTPALAGESPIDGAPSERHGGLLRADGSERPVAIELARIARERRPLVAPAAHRRLDEDSYYDGLPATTEAAYDAYAAEERPAEPG